MKKVLFKAPAIALMIMAVSNALQALAFTASTDYLLPIGSTYLCVATTSYANGYSISNSFIDSYSSVGPPPPPVPGTYTVMDPGALAFHNTQLQVGPHVDKSAGTMPFRLIFDGARSYSGFRAYNMVIDSLYVLGNTPVPPTFIIRESPTFISTGEITITTLGNGSFEINSFFDIFTEISLDAGLTWSPSNGSSRYILQANPPVYMVPSNDLPPVGSTYLDPGTTIYANASSFTKSSLDLSTTHYPPPADLAGYVFRNGRRTFHVEGSPSTLGLFDVQGDVTEKQKFSHTDGVSKVYDTELISLDLSGGTLPAGTMIRESPTLASTGQTVIRPIGGGNYQISSFFDVFTEISMDGGQTWSPSQGSSHYVMQPNNPNSIPTLGTWGLMAMGVLLLGMGVFFMRRMI